MNYSFYLNKIWCYSSELGASSSILEKKYLISSVHKNFMRN